MAAGPTGVDKQPRRLGEPSTATSASLLKEEVHRGSPKILQEPVVPTEHADQKPAPDVVNVQSDAADTHTAQLRQPEDISGGAGDSLQEGRRKHAQHALPGGSHKWANYASTSVLPGQPSPEAKPLTTLQASQCLTCAACPRTLATRLAPSASLLVRGAGLRAWSGLCRPCQQQSREYRAGK